MVPLLYALSCIISFNGHNNSRTQVFLFYRWWKLPQEGKKWAHWHTHTKIADQDSEVSLFIYKIIYFSRTFLHGNSNFLIHRAPGPMMSELSSVSDLQPFSAPCLLTSGPQGSWLNPWGWNLLWNWVAISTHPSGNDEYPFAPGAAWLQILAFAWLHLVLFNDQEKSRPLALFTQLISN